MFNWLQVINIRIFFKFIVAALSAVVSVHRSKEFFKLIDKFDKFDTISLQTQCSSNFKTQKFYLLYALSVEFYYLSISVYYSDISVVILLIWTLVSASTILMIIQYVVFVGLIRERYRSANFIFASSKCSNIINLYQTNSKRWYFIIYLTHKFA